MKTPPPIEPLAQKSFGAPLPEDVRQAMRRQLATTRAEWQAEVDALALRNTMKGKGNAETSSKTPLESMASRQISTINLQLNGQPYGQVNTDPAGAASLNQFLGELSRQKGASSS